MMIRLNQTKNNQANGEMEEKPGQLKQERLRL